LVIEHAGSKRLDNLIHFVEQRKYGNSSFSFFVKTDSEDDQASQI